MANKMADKKKNTSQSETVESKVRGSDKEQSKNVKAVARQRDERRERGGTDSKKRETRQPSSFQSRFRNNRIVRFVREAYNELRYKVTWPTFQEARNMTIMVIALSAAVAILLFVVDLGLLQLFKLISSH